MKTVFASVAYLIVLTCALPAQGDAPTSKPASSTFDEFVKAVDAAHHQSDQDRDLDQFVGDLSIRTVETGADNIEVRLAAQFLRPNLLRYSVREADRSLERGRDTKGAWMRNGDRVVTLPGREFKNDLRELNRHVGLAKQLLEFLDPAKTLRQLRDRKPLEKRTLVLGRLDRGECDYVSGVLDGYPLFEKEGETHTVSIEIWARDGIVQAVEATPIDAAGKPAAVSELVLMDDYEQRAGILIPTKLQVFRRPPAPERPRSLATIEITKLDLAPALAEAAFQRPK